MHLSILKVVLIAVVAALVAGLAVFMYSIRFGEDPSGDGPRALISEFLGYWIGGFLLICSFMVEGMHLQWKLRGVAALAVVAGVGLSFYFANTAEVPETADKEPTGFKSDTTSIHLE
jgi:hypothetical protein